MKRAPIHYKSDPLNEQLVRRLGPSNPGKPVTALFKQYVIAGWGMKAKKHVNKTHFIAAANTPNANPRLVTRQRKKVKL